MNFVRLGCIALILLLALSLAQDWRATRFLRDLWHRYGDWAKWYLMTSPGTYVYLFILLITTWVLLGMPEEVREHFITHQSTNLRQFTSNPFRVLFRSAFFVTGAELLQWIVFFGVVVAPAERWLGTGRTALVFAIGHVVATLGSVLDLWIHLTWFNAPDFLWDVEDTGSSYGFLAIAALMIYRLRGWSQWALGAVLAFVMIWGAWHGHGFTARGHMIAVLVGLLMYRVTKLPSVTERLGPGRSIVELWKRSTADGAPSSER